MAQPEEVSNLFHVSVCAQFCVESSFSDNTGISGIDRRESTPQSLMQETRPSPYTIIHQKVPRDKSNRPSSKRSATYDKPPEQRTESAVNRARPRQSRRTKVKGGHEISPAGHYKRISVPREYLEDPDWEEFVGTTKNQGQDDFVVYAAK